jgi:glycosyltransferase involved in cell wall biosynthesis
MTSRGTEFSVIIPTRDRPQHLARCLQSLRSLDFPAGRWELIVVDDGGTSSVDGAVDCLLQELPARLLRQPAQGPAAARNLAASQSSGRFLAFTDDDCQPEPGWLAAFQECFQAGQFDAVGGQTLNPFPDQYASRAAQYLLDYLYSYLRMPNDDVYLVITNNAAYRREVFLELGGFDGSFPYAGAEDRELGHRLLLNGCRQAFCPAAKVWHHHPLTLAAYLRQQLRYGRGNAHFQRALRTHGYPLRIGQRRRPQFHLELARRMWQDRQPPRVWLAVFLGQGAHWVGTWLETFENVRLRRDGNGREAPLP